MNIKSRNLIFFLLLSSSLYANPFLNRDKGVAPQVRPSPSNSFFVEKQFELRETIALYLKEYNDPNQFWKIVLISFLYGFFHALGPGHRKSIAFSLTLSRKTKAIEPFMIGLLSALTHGGAGLFLIVLFKFLLNSNPSLMGRVALYLEGFTYIILMLFSLILILKTIFKLFGNKKVEEPKGQNIYLALFISSLFPCPGVIMILTFAIGFNVIKLGLISILFVSLGMAVTISLSAYLGYWGRVGIFSFFNKRKNQINIISIVLSLISYFFIFILCLWMCLPFLHTLIHMLCDGYY